MFCLNCGKELPEGANCCPICGTPTYKTIPKNVPVTAGVQVGVAAPVADTAPAENAVPAENAALVENDNAAQNTPPVTNSVPAASTAAPKTGKSREKLLITLLSVVSALLVLTLVASVVKMPGTNKSIISSLSAPKGMVEPGAASEQELIDTLKNHTILSEECIKLMSNSSLYNMYYTVCNWGVNESNYIATRKEYRDMILSGDPDKINELILNESGGDYWDGGYYRYENIANCTLHIGTAYKEKLSDISLWPNSYLHYYPDSGTTEFIDFLDAENNAIEWVRPVSGYFELSNGEEYEFGPDEDFSSDVSIVKANGRYYVYWDNLYALWHD